MGFYQNTLQSIVNLALTHVDLMPLAGVAGISDEPALSLCNDVLSDILLFSAIDWKFNRLEMPFLVTCPNRQDYIFAGAVAFTLGGTASGASVGLATANAITQSGFTTTVNTLQSHRFAVGDTVYMSGNTVSAYNSTFTDNGTSSAWSGGWVITAITTNSFTFVHSSSGLGNSGAAGISDFGWLCDGSMKQMVSTNSPQTGRPIQAVKEIGVWTHVADPEKVCVLKDNGDGTLKIRFKYVPSTTLWAVHLVYQGRCPTKTSLGDNWSPIPDDFSAVYRQGFLYRAYRYNNSSSQNAEFQKFEEIKAKAAGADDREEGDQHVVPEESLTDGWGF